MRAPTVDVWPELVGEQPQRVPGCDMGDVRPAMPSVVVHYAPLSMEQVFRADPPIRLTFTGWHAWRRSLLSNRLRSLGFQSKLLIMLLIVSVVSVLVAGLIGYTSGTNSLRDAEFRRLTQLRESRA